MTAVQYVDLEQLLLEQASLSEGLSTGNVDNNNNNSSTNSTLTTSTGSKSNNVLNWFKRRGSTENLVNLEPVALEVDEEARANAMRAADQQPPLIARDDQSPPTTATNAATTNTTASKSLVKPALSQSQPGVSSKPRPTTNSKRNLFPITFLYTLLTLIFSFSSRYNPPYVDENTSRQLVPRPSLLRLHTKDFWVQTPSVIDKFTKFNHLFFWYRCRTMSPIDVMIVKHHFRLSFDAIIVECADKSFVKIVLNFWTAFDSVIMIMD
jgi:hypothetical protein